MTVGQEVMSCDITLQEVQDAVPLTGLPTVTTPNSLATWGWLNWPHGGCLLEELDLVVFTVEHLDWPPAAPLQTRSATPPGTPLPNSPSPICSSWITEERGISWLLVLGELSVEVGLIVGLGHQ